MPSLLQRSCFLFGESLTGFVSVKKNRLARPSWCIFKHVQGRGLGMHCCVSGIVVAGGLKTGSGGVRGGGGIEMGYWLLKTEPGEWGWEHQERNGGISQWDGVRNALAQRNLRSMRQGDHAFFYHSGKGPAVVGVVEVVRAAYPDGSDESGKHCMVDVRAVAAFPKPVALSVIKSDEGMRDWILLRQSRLSVMPVSPGVWRRVCELGELSSPLCPNATDDDDDDDVAVSEIKPTELERIQPKRRRRGGEKLGLTEAHVEVPLTKTTTTTKKKKQQTRVKDSPETEEEPKKRARRLPAKTKNGISTAVSVQEDAKQEEQSTQSELVSVAELKTYQRVTRKKIDIVEVAVSAPRIPKTQKSREKPSLPALAVDDASRSNQVQLEVGDHQVLNASLLSRGLMFEVYVKAWRESMIHLERVDDTPWRESFL